jgi:hypothetical protein
MGNADRSSPWFRRSYGVFLLVVVGFACLSAACVAIATARGAIVSHDSVAYIAAARSVMAGRGSVIAFWTPHPIPLPFWPPFYPLVLAMAGRLIPEIPDAARWLSIVLFGLSTIVVAILVRKFTNSILFGCAGAFLFASSFTMWRLHAMVMAEPLFILLTLACIYFLDEYLTAGNRWVLALAAMAAGLSVVTRYAGLPMVVWGAVLLALDFRSHPRRRIDALIWAVVAATPLTLVSVWNLRVAGSVAHRPLAWHPRNLVFFRSLLAGVGECILPEALPYRLWITAVVILVLAPGTAIYLIRSGRSRQSYLALLLALQVGFLIGVGFFLDANLGVRRAIQPTFPLLLLFAGCAGGGLLRTRRRRIAVVIGVCALIALPNGPYMYRWVEATNRDPGGFGSRQWRESATMAFIEKLPADTVVYTNLPEPVYLVAGRNTRQLPAIQDPISFRRKTPAEIDREVTEIARSASAGHAAVVYFLNDRERIPFLIDGSELAARSGLRLAEAFDDGTAYMPTWQPPERKP